MLSCAASAVLENAAACWFELELFSNADGAFAESLEGDVLTRLLSLFKSPAEVVLFFSLIERAATLQ